MDQVVFLDRLCARINEVLPEGFAVVPNRDPNLAERHRIAAEEAEREFASVKWPTGAHVIETIRITELTPKGVLADPHATENPVDVSFVFPEDMQGAAGSYVYGYFDSQSGWTDSGGSQRLVDAAFHVLDELQDSICEALREPWPAYGQASVPALHGQLGPSGIELWFETAGNPVLSLGPVSIADPDPPRPLPRS